MADASTPVEQGISTDDIREFKLGFPSVVSAKQKGLVTQLSHSKFGTTFLIDVTDRDDLTRRGENDPSTEEDIIGNFMGLDDKKIGDHYSINNGVVALVTDQLDPDGKTRVYIGVKMSDPRDQEGKEITSHILYAAGFQSGDFYVPFSFNSHLVPKYVAEEIRNAINESGNPQLFAGYQKLLE